jgi:predicted dehydrogenase
MTIKIGIIGCGAITKRAFLPGFAEPGSAQALKALPYYNHYGCENAEVIALADIDEHSAKSLAKTFKVPQVFQDWKELLKIREMDAVCINTPNYLHCEMTVAAAEAGKHIMVEKPMAATVEQADAMIAAAHKAGVYLMVDQTQRFWPLHEVAADIVKSGMIGKIFSLRGRMAHAGPEFWSPGSKWFLSKSESVHGAMFDIGIHNIDVIRFISGMDITEVAAFADTLAKDIEVEDNAVAIFRFENRAMGVLEASWTCNPRETSLSIYGEYGNLRIGQTPAQPIYVEFFIPEAALSRDIPAGNVTAGIYVPEIPKQSKHGGPWQHFVDALRNKTEPSPNGEDGCKSLEVILAAFKSSDEKRTIGLPLERK